PDRHAAVDAQAHGGRVHDGQAVVEDVEVGERREAPGVGVRARVRLVDAVDLVLGHEHHVRLDLEGPQGGGGVRREEGVAGAGREDDYPPLLEVTQGAAPDVRLGDLLDGYRGLDPG